MKTKDLIRLLQSLDPTGERIVVRLDSKPVSSNLWPFYNASQVDLMLNPYKSKVNTGPHINYEYYKEIAPYGERKPTPGLILV